jgi:serine/threonine-protein kinase RsbW
MLVRFAARSTHSMVFAGTPQSAPAARRMVRDLLAGCPRLDDCELIATEFVANAIQHSDSGHDGGAFVFTIVVGDDRVRIEVEDQGNGGPGGWYPDAAPGVPPAPAEDPGAVERGRGLFIVRAIADETGHHSVHGNRHVAWAELGWYGS